MKNTAQHTPGPLPHAIASTGEQACDFARDQTAKFRPGGANYRRLRDLQDAGEHLQKSPALYAAAPDLLRELKEAHAFLNSLLNAKPNEAIDFLTNNGDKVSDGLFTVITQAESD